MAIMNAYLIQQVDQIDISMQEWNDLLQQNETNTIFQTREWFNCWWKTYGRGHGLFFIIVKHNNEICGFAPLYIKKNNHKKTLYFIGEGNADYTDFVTNTNKDIFLNRVFDVILSHKDKWDNLVLNNIPEFSKTTEIIKELCGKNKLKFHYHNNIICPTLEIKGNQKNLNKITNKKSIARKLNYYYKTGKINFKNISNLEQAKRHLENFFKQHITRCSIADYNSLFLNENNKIFYRKLLDELLPGKWIIFSVIEFDDRPISYHFGFDYNNKVIWYKPSFDISFYKHSPGQLMVKHLIDYSIKNDREELDFTIGDENFKHRFTNKIKRNCYIKIYSKNSSYYINRMMSLLIRIAKPISNKLTSA